MIQGIKFSLPREVLLESLKHRKFVAERKNNLASLSNVQIEAHGNKIYTRIASNIITAQSMADASVDNAGIVTVSAHKLYNAVNSLEKGITVNMELTETKACLVVSAGTSKFLLHCLDPESLPKPVKISKKKPFILSGTELKRLLMSTQHVAAKKDIRYYLNGVYLHVADSDKGKVLRCVATDGHHLASVEQTLPKRAANMHGVIIPHETITEVKELAKKAKEVQVTATENRVQFEVLGTVITSKVIEGRFPDYQNIILKNSTVKAITARMQLLQAVNRVAMLSDSSTHAIKFSLRHNQLTISTQNSAQESATEVISVDYNGHDLDIHFNYKLIVNTIKHIKDENIQLLLKDSYSSMTLKGTEDTDALFILMPMRS